MAWQVTGQTPTTGQGPDGTWGEGVRVAFSTDSGAVGNVFVPKNVFSEATVRTMIEREVQKMQSVSGLSG
jgi:hypothetical protein